MSLKNIFRKILGTDNLKLQVDLCYNEIQKLKKTQFLNNEETNRSINEIIWANIFNNTVNKSIWLKNTSISPGRFAAGYNFLYVLYRILNDKTPLSIIEFGLGQTSKITLDYAQFNNNAKIKIVEHDIEWINFFWGKEINPNNFEICKVENEHIKYKDIETLCIKNIKSVIQDIKYDLIIVDAPFYSERYSRSQVFNFLPNNIDKANFCIVIDDYNRHGEKETCHELENIFKKNHIVFYKGIYHGMKDIAIYCSENNKFLTTL